jgi:cytochrome P450
VDRAREEHGANDHRRHGVSWHRPERGREDDPVVRVGQLRREGVRGSGDLQHRPLSENHLAFGFGTHFCLGNQLARLELSIMQTKLLQRLPDMRLASDDELPLRPANFVSGLEQMPVVFTPTKPATSS